MIPEPGNQCGAPGVASLTSAEGSATLGLAIQQSLAVPCLGERFELARRFIPQHSRDQPRDRIDHHCRRQLARITRGWPQESGGSAQEPCAVQTAERRTTPRPGRACSSTVHSRLTPAYTAGDSADLAPRTGLPRAALCLAAAAVWLCVKRISPGVYRDLPIRSICA